MHFPDAQAGVENQRDNAERLGLSSFVGIALRLGDETRDLLRVFDRADVLAAIARRTPRFSASQQLS